MYQCQLGCSSSLSYSQPLEQGISLSSPLLVSSVLLFFLSSSSLNINALKSRLLFTTQPSMSHHRIPTLLEYSFLIHIFPSASVLLLLIDFFFHFSCFHFTLCQSEFYIHRFFLYPQLSDFDVKLSSKLSRVASLTLCFHVYVFFFSVFLRLSFLCYTNLFFVMVTISITRSLLCLFREVLNLLKRFYRSFSALLSFQHPTISLKTYFLRCITITLQ